MKNVMSRPAVIFKYLFLVVATFTLSAAYVDINFGDTYKGMEYASAESYGQNIKITLQYSRTMFAQEDVNDPNYKDFNTVELYTQFRF